MGAQAGELVKWSQTPQNRLPREVDLDQAGTGFEVVRHSAVYSQMIDFFHYRECWGERPSGSGTLVEGASKALWKRDRKRVQFCLQTISPSQASNLGIAVILSSSGWRGRIE